MVLMSGVADGCHFARDELTEAGTGLLGVLAADRVEVTGAHGPKQRVGVQDQSIL